MSSLSLESVVSCDLDDRLVALLADARRFLARRCTSSFNFVRVRLNALLDWNIE